MIMTMINEDILDKVTERYWQKVRDLKRDSTNGKSRFTHITNNILCAMIGDRDMVTGFDISWNEVRKNYLGAMKKLRTYLDLIDKYPEFREAELKLERGFFNDIPVAISEKNLAQIGYTGNANYYYIDEAKERLRQ
jgi:uncharacterized protein YlxP (DUF503 family)